MDLTPRHIQEKQFNDAFRGYSHEEVDMFLDEVAEAFEKVFRENQSFHQRYKQLEEELQQAKGTEDMLKRTLITAQRTAEEAVEEAKTKAQGMIVAAERRVQEIVASAERKAQEIIADAHIKERELQGTIDGLKRFDQEYRTRLRAFIESQLNVLSEGPVPQSLAPPPSAPLEPRPQMEPRPEPIPETQQEPSEREEFAPHINPVSVETESAESESVQESEQAPVESTPVRVSVPASGPSSRPSESQGPPRRNRESRPESAEENHDRPHESDDDDKTIKKLFWGED